MNEEKERQEVNGGGGERVDGRGEWGREKEGSERREKGRGE